MATITGDVATARNRVYQKDLRSVHQKWYTPWAVVHTISDTTLYYYHDIP